MKLQWVMILMLIATPPAAAAEQALAKLGSFELWQRNCGKSGCETWIQSGEAKASLRGLESMIHPLKEAPLNVYSGLRSKFAIAESKSFQWCDVPNCDSEGNSQLTLSLVELDSSTRGILATTAEGFETVYYHWNLLVPEGKAFKQVIEGKSGRHSPPSIAADWGFVPLDKSLGYYFLEYYWQLTGTLPDQTSPELARQFFRFETRRWDPAKKEFGSVKADLIPLWALLMASGKTFEAVQKEAEAKKNTLEDCGDLRYRFLVANSSPFNKLAPGTWVFAVFSPDRTELERLQAEVVKCAPDLKPLIKRAF